MHHVTSSVFIPSLCALISAGSRVLLLKSYFFAICVWAIARGQPAIDTKAFMKNTRNPDHPSLESTNGSAWDKILEQARLHEDEHATKTIRALAAWGSAFGTKKARVPLSIGAEQQNGVPKNLAINSADANAKVLNRGRQEGEILSEDADLSPRSWREWKNGRLPSSSPVRSILPIAQNGSPKTPTHRRKPSEDVDLSPRAWRNAVNDGVVDIHGDEIESEETLENMNDSLPKTEMPGSEYLDGSLFLRVAILVLHRTGWDFDAGVIEGRPPRESDSRFWDFGGFFEQHLNKAEA